MTEQEWMKYLRAKKSATRLDAIEECAREIERWEHADEPLSYLDLIDRIRALKDKP